MKLWKVEFGGNRFWQIVEATTIRQAMSKARIAHVKECRENLKFREAKLPITSARIDSETTA